MFEELLSSAVSLWKAGWMSTLVGLSYSPWTQKARWALDLSGADYRWKPYTPMVSELGLRLKMRKLGGALSVPVLLTTERSIEGSLAIADHANGIAEAPDRTTLFPDRAAVLGFNRLADHACDEYRIKVGERVLENPEAQRESMKGVVPSWMQSRTRFAARFVIRRLLRKYKASRNTGAMRLARDVATNA